MLRRNQQNIRPSEGLKYRSSRNSLQFATAIIIIRSSSFISQLVIMRSYGVDSFNSIIQAIGIQTLTTVLFTLGLESQIILQLQQYGKISRLISIIYKITFLALFCGSLVSVIFQLIPLWIIFSAFSGALMGYLSGIQMPVLRFHKFGTLVLRLNILSAIFAIFLKSIFTFTPIKAVVAWSGIDLLITITSVLVIRTKMQKLNFFKRDIPVDFKLSGVYLMSLVAFWFLLQFDRVYATHFLPSNMAASYGLLLAISNTLLSFLVEYMRNSNLQFLQIDNSRTVVRNILNVNFILIPLGIVLIELFITNFGNLLVPASFSVLFSNAPQVFTGIQLWLCGMLFSSIRKYHFKNLKLQGLPIFLASIGGCFFLFFISISDRTDLFIYFFTTVSLFYFFGGFFICKVPIKKILKLCDSKILILAVAINLLLFVLFIETI